MTSNSLAASGLGWSQASGWARAACAAAIVSLAGFVAQTVLDHVSAPKLVGQLVFYGWFAGFGLGGLALGVVAIARRRRSPDHSALLGWIAIGYVVLAQLVLLVWD